MAPELTYVDAKNTTNPVIRAILSENPVPPSAHDSRLSPRLDRLVLQFLEKDPNKRGSLRSPLDGIR
jgi:hypothetical protein